MAPTTSHSASHRDAMPIMANLGDFDKRSGNLIERLVFNNRVLLVTACLVLTVVLGWFSTRLQVTASFEDMMPQSQQFVQNYKAHAASLGGLGNSVRIVVTNTKGDIYDPKYLETLKQINDKVYLIQGVDRSFMKSIWMPVVRWTDIVAEGYQGGPVMPDGFT